MMENRSRVLGSFRDPSGFLFWQDGLVYRQINREYAEHHDRLVDSGLYQALAEARLLISYREVEMTPAEPSTAYKVIQPEQIPFISYAYRWSFSQPKNAALTREDVYRSYTEQGFEGAIARHFDRQERVRIEKPERMLYLMERRID